MKLRHFGIAAGSLVAMCGLVVACSDDSSTGTTGSSSSSSSSSGSTGDGGSSSSSSSGSTSGSSSGSTSSGGTNQCEIAPGDYKVETTRTSGDAAKCPETSNTITIEASDGGSTDQDAGPNCKVQIDEANCSSVIECEFSNGGFTTTSKMTFSTKSLTGTQASKTVKESDGTVLTDCSYDVKWTKQ